MKMLEKYIVNKETCILIPKYDKYGKLISMVIEGYKIIYVNMSPLDIIKFSLLNHGSSFQGAKDGSKHLLGNTTMNPLMISDRLDLYCFPTKSPTNKQCVWIILGQYENHVPGEKNQLKVIFKQGNSAELDMSSRSFGNKLQNALRLKRRMEDIETRKQDFSELKTICIMENAGSYTFTVSENQL